MSALILSVTISFLMDLYHLGGEPQQIEKADAYERIALMDSTTIEVFEGDSITIVFTACAPQCSSRARVYNKEWLLIRTIEPPFHSIFPLAIMDKKSGQITWTDNDTWEY